MASAITIAIVHDQKQAANFIKKALEKAGYSNVHLLEKSDLNRISLDSLDPDICFLNAQNVELSPSLTFAALDQLNNPPHLVVLYDEEHSGKDGITSLMTEMSLCKLGELEGTINVSDLKALLSNFKGRKPLKKTAYNETQLSPIEVQKGIEKGFIFPVYQPKVSIPDGTLIGVECLARWRYPDGKMLFPGAFIPVAEDHNLMDGLTRSIIQQALKQSVDWHLDGLDLKVSINVSLDNLEDDHFPDFVKQAAENEGADLRKIVLEVTETKIMNDARKPLQTLNRLRSLGVGLSIDDYGTGASSLQQMTRIPADEIKIDRAFVDGAHQDPAKYAILKSSIDLGKQLGMTVTAEGAELLEEWHILEELEADILQGFFVSKPLMAEELTTWHQQWLKDKPQPRDLSHLKKASHKNRNKPAFITSIAASFIAIALIAYQFLGKDNTAEAFNPPAASIAVLPFENMSEDNSKEYFSDGLSEEILDNLAKIKGLFVTARTSAFQFKGRHEDIRDIGRHLNVAYILEGSVRISEGQYRITAQLINARDNFHLWSETFDYDTQNILAIQDDVSAKIATQLTSLLGEQNISLGTITQTKAVPHNLKADDYLRLLEIDEALQSNQIDPTRTNLIQEVFEISARNPDNIDAKSLFIKMTKSLQHLAYNPEDPNRTYLDKGREQMAELLALYPQNAKTYHTGCFFYRYISIADNAIAKDHCSKALLLNPNDVDSMATMARLQFRDSEYDLAFQNAKNAYDRDPFNRLVIHRYTEALVYRNQLDDYQNVFFRLNNTPEGQKSPFHFLPGAFETFIPTVYGRNAELYAMHNQFITWFDANVGLEQNIEMLFQRAPWLPSRHFHNFTALDDLDMMRFWGGEIADLYTHYQQGNYDPLFAPWQENKGMQYDMIFTTVHYLRNAAAYKSGQIKKIMEFYEQMGLSPDLEPVGNTYYAMNVPDIFVSLTALLKIDGQPSRVASWNNNQLGEMERRKQAGFDWPLFHVNYGRVLINNERVEEGLNSIQTALDMGWSYWALKDDPVFYQLTDDPKFQALMSQNDLNLQVQKRRFDALKEELEAQSDNQ